MDVVERARQLAKKPYEAPNVPLPGAFANLSYDQYVGIRSKPGTALWSDENLGFAIEEAPWKRVRNAAKLTRYGCDAYAYAMVALGTLDLVIETGLKAWDIEAAIPIIRGAGGFITDWQGREIGPNGGQMLICGDERVRDEALVLLAADRP